MDNRKITQKEKSIVKRNKANVRDIMDIERSRRNSKMIELRRSGLSYEEIAKHMGLSKGGVYKIIKNERQKAMNELSTNVFLEKQTLANELFDDLVSIQIHIDRAMKMKAYDEDGNDLPMMNTALFEQKRKTIESISKLLDLDLRAEKELEKGSEDSILRVIHLFSEEEKEDDEDVEIVEDKDKTINQSISESIMNKFKDKTGFSTKQSMNEQIAKIYEEEKEK